MTTKIETVAVDQSLLYPSPYKEFWQAFAKNKGAVAGLVFMLIIVFCALFAPWVAPHNPSEQYRDFLLTLINTVIAIAVVSLPSYVRLTRAAVMGELNRDYVTAARLAGATLPRLMFITVLPNCMAPLIVQATLSFSSAILDAAALGFLGLGVQPPTPEWGTMLASARDYIERAWWVVSLPGLTILLSVLAINLMGDGLRDALDPKLKNAA